MNLVSKTIAGLGLTLLAATGNAQEITPGGSAATNSTNDGNVAANAVDNNLNTRWSASGAGQWLQLDLGSARSIGYVRVAFYNGSARSSTFDIAVSTNGTTFTTVQRFTSSGTSTAEQTFDFADRSARYVRYIGQGNSVNAWNSVTEFSVFTGAAGPTPTPRPTPTPVPGGGTWRRANLTNFTSYPDPGSDECINFNGCMWAGQFAFVSGKQPESWVRANNIAAVAQQDSGTYRLKTLRLRQGTRQIDVRVYDMCADSDCSGCCTRNRNAGGVNFLIDIEKYTMQRFGSGSGVTDWQCLDC